MGEKGRASIIGKHSNFFPHATPSLLGVQPCPLPPSTVHCHPLRDAENKEKMLIEISAPVLQRKTKIIMSKMALKHALSSHHFLSKRPC